MEYPRSKPTPLWHRVGVLALSVAAGVTTGHAQSTIGYNSVAAARQAIAATPGATASQQAGWLIVEDKATRSLWSFVPNDHEAYPAAVKRTVAQRDGRAFIDMSILCEAPKPACDRLAESFKALNEQTIRNLGGGP
jgi:hypothetical protein